MSSINLYWYRYNKGEGNFGDELNPYIIKKLTNAKITHINLRFLNDNKFVALKYLFKAFITSEINCYETLSYIKYNFITKPNVLVCIGSVLHNINYNKCTVWGAGIISQNIKLNNANFVAVRGKYSQKRLLELNYLPPQAIGDPAILLPKIYKPKIKNNYKIGIIPHYVHYETLKYYESENIKVINLLDDIETVINFIYNCDITLSTSLHGIIVSHAYKVPSLWSDFKEIKKELAGDNIKFYDYFSSVCIKEYKPICIDNIDDLLKDGYVNQLKTRNHRLMLPSENTLTMIQQNLLKSAPFEIKFKYV